MFGCRPARRFSHLFWFDVNFFSPDTAAAGLRWSRGALLRAGHGHARPQPHGPPPCVWPPAPAHRPAGARRSNSTHGALSIMVYSKKKVSKDMIQCITCFITLMNHRYLECAHLKRARRSLAAGGPGDPAAQGAARRGLRPPRHQGDDPAGCCDVLIATF